MPFLDAPDVRLYFDDHPARSTASPDAGATVENAPVVLIHGWACSSADWDLLVGRLAADRRVITVDLRGNGRSSVPTAGYSPRVMAGDIVALLDHLGIRQAVVFGHSAGAEVAAAVAVLHPSRVVATVAVDPAYGFTSGDRGLIASVVEQLNGEGADEVAANYFARLDDNPNTSRELAESHQVAARSASTAVAREMFDGFAFGPDSFHFRPETDEFLRRRTSPLLGVYRNEARGAVGAEFVTQPGDEVRTYLGAGHWPHQEQPDRFVADVTEWLAGLPR